MHICVKQGFFSYRMGKTFWKKDFNKYEFTKLLSIWKTYVNTIKYLYKE